MPSNVATICSPGKPNTLNGKCILWHSFQAHNWQEPVPNAIETSSICHRYAAEVIGPLRGTRGSPCWPGTCSASWEEISNMIYLLTSCCWREQCIHTSWRHQGKSPGDTLLSSIYIAAALFVLCWVPGSNVFPPSPTPPHPPERKRFGPLAPRPRTNRSRDKLCARLLRRHWSQS